MPAVLTVPAVRVSRCAAHGSGESMSGVSRTKNSMRGLGHPAAVVVTAVVCIALLGACVPRPPGDFYAATSPLPYRRSGTVIWADSIAAAPGYGALRVMYHSRDAENRDRAVTGTIYYPTDRPPPGGWPVVSWAHGTSGLSSSCAPSR